MVNCICTKEKSKHKKEKSMIDKFLTTPFSNVDKYVRRNQMIKDRENNG